MSNANPNAPVFYSILSALACALCLVPNASGSGEGPPIADADILDTIEVSETGSEPPQPGVFFAGIIESRRQIEFLSSRKQYEELLKVVAQFRESLAQAANVLPAEDAQRTARFTAASRSLQRLSKAVHTFMWEGEERNLFDAADKLGQLVANIDSLITPDERALALKHIEEAKG